MALEKDHDVIVNRSMMGWTFYPKMFLMGPIAPFYLMGSTSGRIAYERETTLKEIDEDRKENLLSEEGKIALRKRMEAVEHWARAARDVSMSLGYYYAPAIAAFGLILFINYQFLH